MNYPIITPIKTVEELTAVLAAAREDGHAPLYPTHAIHHGGEVVGAWSVCSTPTVNLWHHTQKVSRRESHFLFASLDNLMRCLGKPQFVMPVGPESPYLPFMERAGFVNVGTFHYYLKTKANENPHASAV